MRLSREHAGALNIVATAPLTNLAQALELDPDASGQRIASLTVMGGAAGAPGNVTPAAEANIHNDPEAAAAVLGAGWIGHPRAVGRDHESGAGGARPV